MKTLAMGLPTSDYRLVTWRAGSNTDLSSRFAAVRVRAAHRDHWRAALRDAEWLLIEWSEGQSEPEKCQHEAMVESLKFHMHML